MSGFTGDIILNLLDPNSPSKHTHTRTHTQDRTLTLRGDEMVGSMVALKERREMTCWVSHLSHTQLCVSPFSCHHLTRSLTVPCCVLLLSDLLLTRVFAFVAATRSHTLLRPHHEKNDNKKNVNKSVKTWLLQQGLFKSSQLKEQYLDPS